MTDTHTRQDEIIVKGIGTSPGICIGKAYIVDREGVDVVEKYYIPDDRVQLEKTRFKSAVKKAKDELHAIIEEIPEDLRDHARILETHVVLLKDKMLYEKTIETIDNERVNAEWALKKVTANIYQIFTNMKDPYFRERGADIIHVSDRILRNLTGTMDVDIKGIDKRVVLVADDLSPAETSQIQLERIMGLVTKSGGVASHTSIIARSLEIPAVMGVENFREFIRNDDIIALDGTTGTVVIHPGEETLEKFVRRRIRYEQKRSLLVRTSHAPAKSADGVFISVMGNIELPEEVVGVRNYGGDGIGLYRTEFQYMNRKGFPGEFELFDKYRDVVEVMTPKPVTIRTLDINGDKALGYGEWMKEPNPALGLRAIRYCLKKPEVFRTQLRAILRAAAYGNVRIMFPMISSYEEVVLAKEHLREAAESLDREGIAYGEKVEVGIMVEVPSVVAMIQDLAEEVDFFSIGTNDLIQYGLAIDRTNRQVAHMYNPLHPAILRMLKLVSDISHDEGVRLFMCGEMAGDPFNIPILFGMGLDELSMNAQSIPVVKRAIRSIRMDEARDVVSEVLKMKTGKQITEMVKSRYAEILVVNHLE